MVLPNGRASKVVADVYECRKRAGEENLLTLGCYCWEVGVSVEREIVVWMLVLT
jgi:hypothetical protein